MAVLVARGVGYSNSVGDTDTGGSRQEHRAAPATSVHSAPNTLSSNENALRSTDDVGVVALIRGLQEIDAHIQIGEDEALRFLNSISLTLTPTVPWLKPVELTGEDLQQLALHTLAKRIRKSPMSIKPSALQMAAVGKVVAYTERAISDAFYETADIYAPDPASLTVDVGKSPGTEEELILKIRQDDGLPREEYRFIVPRQKYERAAADLKLLFQRKTANSIQLERARSYLREHLGKTEEDLGDDERAFTPEDLKAILRRLYIAEVTVPGLVLTDMPVNSVLSWTKKGVRVRP